MKIRCLQQTFATALATATLAACQTAAPGPMISGPAPQQASALSADAYVADVIAEDYALDAPDAIPSGWTTFRMKNEGNETHFIYLTRLPEGKTYDDLIIEVNAPLNELWYARRAGEIDRAELIERLGTDLPGWFWTDLEQMGGPGLIAPGGTAQVTMNLAPGNYVMECYMKTPEGEFHAIEGMTRPLTVTSQSSDASAPAAGVQMTLTNDGIEAPIEMARGQHTIAIYFAEHPEMVKHDVHLARLAGEMDVEEVVSWMDWTSIEGLANPAPTTFLGGTHEMPAGYTAYITVDLEPGRYAWISESTGPMGVWKEFTVR